MQLQPISVNSAQLRSFILPFLCESSESNIAEKEKKTGC